MSTIVLYEKKNNDWNSLGLGPLTEAINPLVTREKNGIYDLTFEYPVNGKLFNELKVGRWVTANAGPTIVARKQKFEIAQITKPKNGIVTVYCEHYRYKLLRSIVTIGIKHENIPAQTALNYLKERMQPKGDFSFFSDVGTKSSIDFTDPSKFKNAQEALGGVAGSILDNFGGEYLFDNNQVKLLVEAGKKTNIVIAYGKNLTDITQEESIENTYTSIYGWAKIGTGDDEEILTLPEIYIDSDYVNNYTERRIQMVDFSDKEPKDVTTLRSMVKSYIKSNKVGVPKVSIKASYVDLASSVMDTQLKNLEEIDLCDWVTITFNQLKINTTAQIVKTVWNVSLDRYESIELGESRTDFAKVIEESKEEIKQVTNKINWLEQAQQEATDIIKNPGKGHVVIYPSLADPQEFLIMDTTDIKTAKKVWRWNVGGLGFSSTGYNGSYGLAMTNNGAMVADRMTTGTLRAINIIGVAITGSTIDGGVITNSNGYSKIILRDGTIKTYYNNVLRSAVSGVRFTLYDSKGVAVMDLDSDGVSINKENTTTTLGYLGRGRDVKTGKEELAMNVNVGNIGCIAVQENTNGIYIRKIAASSAGAHISNLIMGGSYVGGSGEIKNANLKNAGVSDKFTVYNNVNLGFYSNLNMHGYSILNQSDIRLKENIEETKIDGIEETKKLNFVEFDRKQKYRTKDINKQPSSKRELGLIAQYSPFLAIESDFDNYLSIDVNKQIMLNSLTNKQLIELVESQEKRITELESKLEKVINDG
ncbi:phage tail spike protein [Enterococcus faecalis]|uniref:phage tail spike protein n=1 Tax=Enterococcus faecalis TaxID=1351 RepID=UPI002DBF581A|nr:phage tail spike protein [Enterococcus faecalis]MEB7954402.1 phage tail protein [Enterococcus faecalis]MEB7964563.1 phage tail protein [Enterococcus faecalis]